MNTKQTRTPVKSKVKVFTQWRPSRPRSGDTRTIDNSVQILYVCAFWRRDGKQVGWSFSAYRNGLEGAVRKTLSKARKEVPSYRATTRDVMAKLVC